MVVDQEDDAAPDADLDASLRQALAAERLADYFVPRVEAKRFARFARVLSWVGTRMVLVAGILVGGSELVQWLYGTWEIRNTARDYAEVGSEIFYKENNPEVAKTLLEEAISLNPDNSKYRFIQAYIDGMGTVRTLLNLDRPYTKEELDQTHEALGKALFLERQSPEKPEAQILRAQIYAALFDFDRAKASLLNAIQKAEKQKKRESDPVERYINMSFEYLSELSGITGLDEYILTTFNIEKTEQKNLDSHLSFAYVRLALVENEIGTKEDAVADLQKALEYDPNSKWAYLWLGVFESEAKKWQEARAHYDQALKYDPRFDLAYYNKGWTFLKSKPKDYAQARSMFQKAISINPNYKEAYYGLGMVYGYQDKYEVAHKYLSKAVEIDERFLTGWKWRGVVNEEMNEFEAALEDFSKAISLNPSNADLYVRRARVLTKDKRHEAALQDLLLASDFNALNYRIPYYTGKVYADLAQYGNAISQFTRAIELREGYNEAYAARAEARLGLGDVVEARKDYDIAVENTNYRPERMLVKRAAFFYSQQQYEEAMVDYRLAREKNPRHAVAWLGETRAAMKLDDPISALYAINEYLKLKPKSEEALAIQSKLAGG